MSWECSKFQQYEEQTQARGTQLFKRERERERESLKGENYDLTRDRVALINFKSHAPRPFECDYLPKFIQVFNSFF